MNVRDSGYESLAIAVIEQAVEDYSRACQGLKECENYDGEYKTIGRQVALNYKRTVYESIYFFRNSVICEVIIKNPTDFMKQVDEKINQGLVFDFARGKWK